MKQQPKTRNENIVIQEMDSEILIYDLEENKAFCLNETSAMIYGLCDGRRNVGEIRQALRKRLNQPISDDLIWLALNDFKRDGLLQNNEHFEIDFMGLNRRQVIKKIGFASMIMLPIISSVVAPNAAMAASGPTNIPLFGACPTGSGCASGLTCTNCSGGNCSGGNTCCTRTGNLFGSGTVVANCTGICSPASCCSQTASPVANPSCPSFNPFDCVCD